MVVSVVVLLVGDKLVGLPLRKTSSIGAGLHSMG